MADYSVLEFHGGGIIGEHSLRWLFAHEPLDEERLVFDARAVAPGWPREREAPEVLWDEGEASFLTKLTERVRKGSEAIRFELAGRRLHGGYVLEKAGVDHQGTRWVLRKLRDAHAPEQKVGKNAACANWPVGEGAIAMLEEYYDCVASESWDYFRDRGLVCLVAPHGVAEPMQFAPESPERVSAPRLFAALGRRCVVEIHAENARKHRTRRPDWMLLDLEPPYGAPFAQLMTVAREARLLFDELGLRATWCTLGGLGLRAMLPLSPRTEALAVFDFAQMLAEMIYERAPTGATLSPLPSRRVRLVFQGNHPHHPSLAPFSPMALSDPVLVLPLDWAELTVASELPRFVLSEGFERLRPRLARGGELLVDAAGRPNDLEEAFLGMQLFTDSSRSAV